MPWSFDDETGLTTTHDSWCAHHDDLGDPCASQPVEIIGFTSWLKRMSDGSLVAVGNGQDLDAGVLDAISARVTELRGLLAADRVPVRAG